MGFSITNHWIELSRCIVTLSLKLYLIIELQNYQIIDFDWGDISPNLNFGAFPIPIGWDNSIQAQFNMT